jgi:hypothetical protein
MGVDAARASFHSGNATSEYWAELRAIGPDDLQVRT